MSQNYDNWERLVDVVLLREKLRRIALEDSRESSFNSISSSRFSFGSSSNTVVNERDLDIIQPFDHHQDIEISRSVTTLVRIVLKVYLKDGQIKQKFIKRVLRLLKLHVEESNVESKKRTKFMKEIATFPGTKSVAWDKKEMNFIVVGNGIDAVLMVRDLRKSCGPATLISIRPAKVPEEEEENEK